MDDRAFDDLLRAALVQANLEDQAEALAQTEAPDFSPAYLRDRMRLLADPQDWCRRRKRRQGWKGPLRSAVCAALVCAVGFSCLVAASPTVRAEILSWVMQRYEDRTEFHFVGSGDTPETLPDYALSTLPEGFTEQERIHDGLTVMAVYQDAQGGVITLQCMSTAGAAALTLDSEGADVQTVTVNGCPGELYVHQPPRRNLVLWIDEGAERTFLLAAPVDGETLLQLAESVTPQAEH